MSLNIEALPINTLILDTDPWASGFFDADGSFGVYAPCRAIFEIKQSETDHNNNSKNNCMQGIADYFGVKLRENNKNGKKKQYIVRLDSLIANQLIVSYIDRWPLKSSKYMNY